MKSTKPDGSWIAVERHARVLGIDPGTRLAGYAVVDFDTRSAETTVVDAGVLRLSADASLSVRLQQLFDDLNQVIAEHAPTHACVEAVFSHTDFAGSAITLAHARGVVLLALQQRALPIAEIPPAEIKKAVAGNGRATKEQMQRAVMTQCALATLPEPPDVADAIAIALCGGRRLRGVQP